MSVFMILIRQIHEFELRIELMKFHCMILAIMPYLGSGEKRPKNLGLNGIRTPSLKCRCSPPSIELPGQLGAARYVGR